MPKIEEQTLTVIKELFVRYEKEILESKYSTNSKAQRVGYVRRFVDWLADQYSPADYEG